MQDYSGPDRRVPCSRKTIIHQAETIFFFLIALGKLEKEMMTGENL